MNIFNKFFKKAPEIAKTRSSKKWEKLTDYERYLIATTLKCPDCGLGQFLEGPSGGCSTNVLCSNEACGSRFNVSPFGSERIADKSSGRQA